MSTEYEIQVGAAIVYSKTAELRYLSAGCPNNHPIRSGDRFCSTCGSPVGKSFYPTSNIDNVIRAVNERVTDDSVYLREDGYVGFILPSIDNTKLAKTVYVSANETSYVDLTSISDQIKAESVAAFSEIFKEHLALLKECGLKFEVKYVAAMYSF
jgi:hypothetical protein